MEHPLLIITSSFVKYLFSPTFFIPHSPRIPWNILMRIIKKHTTNHVRLEQYSRHCLSSIIRHFQGIVVDRLTFILQYHCIGWKSRFKLTMNSWFLIQSMVMPTRVSPSMQDFSSISTSTWLKSTTNGRDSPTHMKPETKQLYLFHATWKLHNKHSYLPPRRILHHE